MEKMKWGWEQRLRDGSWDSTNLSFEKDRAYGFSWPQRNYRCSFCKKEFKSAQALGGHMNVHRRDRARMRLSPSWDCPNSGPNPNPNPSFSSSSSAAKIAVPYSMSFHSSVLSAAADVPNSVSSDEKGCPLADECDVMALCRGERGKKNKGAMLEVTGFARRKDARVWKGNEFVRLDLNLGLIQDAKEDLDLELKL